MANDQNDFAPSIRNASWWSGDSRKAANGRAVDAILTKQGKLPIEDISHLEPVRMGHVMQPVIGRLFQEKHGIELRIFDYFPEKYLEDIINFIVLLCQLIENKRGFPSSLSI